MKMPYFENFDGLRAVAIAAVLLRHGFPIFFKGGFLGVDLFFVLSGFLITQILLVEYHNTSNINLMRFYQRRACRLLPALFLAIIVALLLRDYSPQENLANIPGTVFPVVFYYANFVFRTLGGLAPTWSLAIEEQFYMVWPLLMLFFLKRNIALGIRITIIIISALILLRGIMAIYVHDRFFLYAFTLARFDSLLIGSLLSLAFFKGNIPKILHNKGIAEGMLILFILLCFFSSPTQGWLYYGGYSIIAIIFSILIINMVYRKQDYLCFLLQMRLVQYTGRISYGLYLFHLPIYYSIDYFLNHYTINAPNIIIVFLVKIPLSYLLAVLSYELIEKRFLLMKWKYL